MKVKSKKRILKTILTLVFVIVVTIPFIDLYKKNKTKSRFNDIESSIYQSLPENSIESSVLYLSYCDTVAQFVKKNPIRIKYNIDCEVYSNQQNTLRLRQKKTDFIKHVQIIENEYQRLDREANIRMFIILIVSQILLALLRKFIDRKYKELDNEK